MLFKYKKRNSKNQEEKIVFCKISLFALSLGIYESFSVGMNPNTKVKFYCIAGQYISIPCHSQTRTKHADLVTLET